MGILSGVEGGRILDFHGGRGSRELTVREGIVDMILFSSCSHGSTVGRPYCVVGHWAKIEHPNLKI